MGSVIHMQNCQTFDNAIIFRFIVVVKPAYFFFASMTNKLPPHKKSILKTFFRYFPTNNTNRQNVVGGHKLPSFRRFFAGRAFQLHFNLCQLSKSVLTAACYIMPILPKKILFFFTKYWPWPAKPRGNCLNQSRLFDPYTPG